MNPNRLFRQEVIEHNKNKQYGTVLINTPLPYAVLTIASSMVIGLVCLFLIVGEFSEKFIVNGYIESTKAMARVYPNKKGVIAKRFIQQGDVVEKGDKLFLIDTSYDGLGKKQKDIRAQLQKKKHAIEQQIHAKREHVHALKPLLDKKYIPLATYNEQHDDLVALEQQKNNVDIELINEQREKSYLIRAPIAGIISSVLYQEGQYTQADKPMLKILPKNTDLMASLFIPVRQSGFLHHQNKVMIRYDAYPYQRFGFVRARIQHVGESVVMHGEELTPLRIGSPYYKVLAQLDTPFIFFNGKTHKIKQGMTFSAVIVGERKKVWRSIHYLFNI